MTCEAHFKTRRRLSARYLFCKQKCNDKQIIQYPVTGVVPAFAAPCLDPCAAILFFFFSRRSGLLSLTASISGPLSLLSAVWRRLLSLYAPQRLFRAHEIRRTGSPGAQVLTQLRTVSPTAIVGYLRSVQHATSAIAIATALCTIRCSDFSSDRVCLHTAADRLQLVASEHGRTSDSAISEKVG